MTAFVIPSAPHAPTRLALMKLSAITTMYYSAPYIAEFVQRMRAAMRAISPDYEIVIVNDGSPDDALQVARRLADDDARVIVVDLTRNFGHHKAIMTGLAYTTGDLVFLIDCDLEEAPETLPLFYDALASDAEADAVYSIQDHRQGPLLRRLPGDLYYRIVRALSEFDVPQNILMTRLMTRRYVDDLLRYQEDLYSIEGLWAMTGYKQIPVTIEKTFKGVSSYTWSKKLWLAVYAITAMSSKPLVAIAYLGLAMIVPTGLLILGWIIQYLSGYTSGVDGWTSVIVSMWFLGGLIIFVLGIIGLYLSVIFSETKPRPYSLVRSVYRQGSGEDRPRPSVPPRQTLTHSSAPITQEMNS
jgi:putative glycosyltransferase